MTTAELPDIEKIVVGYLKTQLGSRVVTATPDNQAETWVKVTQINVMNVGGPKTDHFNCWDIQLDCYASANGIGYQGEASDLFRAARAAMNDMPLNTFTGAVVTAVTFGPCPRVPDTNFDPPRQRYVLSANVYAHP